MAGLVGAAPTTTRDIGVGDWGFGEEEEGVGKELSAGENRCYPRNATKETQKEKKGDAKREEGEASTEH